MARKPLKSRENLVALYARITPEMHKELEEIAEEKILTKSDIVRMAIKEYIENN